MNIQLPARSKQRRGSIRLLIAVLVLILLGIIVTQTARGDNPANNPPSAGPIEDMQTLLANDARSRAAEEADQQVMQDARNGLRGTPLPKDGSFVPPAPTLILDPPAPVGIIDHPVPLAGWSTQYHITNEWQDVVAGQRVGIIAGSKADDPAAGLWRSPEQGVLVIIIPHLNIKREFLTPIRAGQTRITESNGTCLTVTTTSPVVTYQFDAGTYLWSCGPIHVP
jgi:hypothetical protein